MGYLIYYQNRHQKRLNNTVNLVVDMNHVFSALVHKERKFYVAECPELGTISQGRSIKEAIKNLKEATKLYIEEF